GSVYYYGGGWDVSASSTYATSRDAVRADQETTSLYHDLYVTLHLTNTLTLVPALSTGVDLREPTRTQSGSGAASLMLSYEAPLRGWNAWTLSSYTASQSSDRTVDGHTVGVSGGVVRDLGKVLSGRASVS